MSLIAAHYGHGLEGQDPDIRRRATYVILEGAPSSSKTALKARVLFAAFLSGGNLARRLAEVYDQVGSQTEAVKLALKGKLGNEIETLQQELRALKNQGSVRDALRMIGGRNPQPYGTCGREQWRDN